MVTISLGAQSFFDVKKMFAVFEQQDAGIVFVIDKTGFFLHRCMDISQDTQQSAGAEATNLEQVYPVSRSKAFAIIREGRGNHFDRGVVDAFFRSRKRSRP